MLVRPVVKRLFFPWKTKEKKARFVRAPHYYGHFIACDWNNGCAVEPVKRL